MQLSKLIGRKEEVMLLGSFPHMAIGLISAMPQLAGTSPESHE